MDGIHGDGRFARPNTVLDEDGCPSHLEGFGSEERPQGDRKFVAGERTQVSHRSPRRWIRKPWSRALRRRRGIPWGENRTGSKGSGAIRLRLGSESKGFRADSLRGDHGSLASRNRSLRALERALDRPAAGSGLLPCGTFLDAQRARRDQAIAHDGIRNG